MLGFHPISSAPVSALRRLATGAAAGSPVYAQSTPSARRDKQNVAKYGSASWVDLSGAAAPSDAPVYAQSLARRITRATTGAVWINPDSSVAASSDLSPYAQGNAQPGKLRIKSTVWVDLDTAVAVSNDLSPYAQSLLRRNPIRAAGAAWVDRGSDEATIVAQGSAKQRPVAATSRYWVDLDSPVAASSDLSPYAQTIVSRETIRGPRRSTGRSWTNGDDFFPPQDDLSAYGQSRYAQSRLVYRPLYQGAVWVDLVDAAVITPVVPGTGAGGKNYFYLSSSKPQRPVISRTPFQAIKPSPVKAPEAAALTAMRQELYALGKQISLKQAQVQRQLLTKTDEVIDPDIGLLMQQMMVEYRLALYNDQAARLLILLLNDR